MLVQLVLEILTQLLFEVLVSFGFESLAHSVRRENAASPWHAALGHFLMGVIAGIISLLLLPHRLAPRSDWPGISLVLSPLATGVVMHSLGELWRNRDKPRPMLFTFHGGAVFAFGMALVRYLHVEMQWWS